ncbi:MAG: hypothetical protein HQL39_16855 [Alphaproteobacteria bacterium]|nr:hypothetical protein [Alphaproteobacteria bacterium]
MAVIADAIAGLAAPILNVVDEMFETDEERSAARAKLQATLLDIAQKNDLAQLDVNKAEAQTGSLFIAGWRPAIGWVCAAGVGWSFVGQPVATWALAVAGVGASIPVIPTEHLFEMVLAMLGMGGLRTFEKLQGVAR